jgi:hypothetical protein
MAKKKYYIGTFVEQFENRLFSHKFRFSTEKNPNDYMHKIALTFLGDECTKTETGYLFNYEGNKYHIQLQNYVDVGKKQYDYLDLFFIEL